MTITIPLATFSPAEVTTPGTPNDLNKFTGHERDQEGGLNLDFTLARFLDGEIGKFYGIDPFHFIHSNYSPYHYVLNNPMKYIDPFGLDTVYTARGQNITVESSMVGSDNNNVFNGELYSRIYSQLQSQYKTGSDYAKEKGPNINASVSFIAQYSSKFLEKQIGSRSYYPNSIISLRPKIFSNFRAIGQTVPHIFLKSSNTLKIASNLGRVSIFTGGLGIGITIYQGFTDQISPGLALFETGMGAFGFWWPIGTAASVAYFGGKLAYEYLNTTQ